MSHQEFTPRVIEKLGYYIYLYIDPRDGTIFYVRKGQGNRAVAHLADASESRKVARIREIRDASLEPSIEILVHNLPDETAALRIESVVIDLLGLDKLTNQVQGWHNGVVGRMPGEAIAALYGARPATVAEPALLIRINRLYRYGMTAEQLCEATRGVWKLSARRARARYAFAVYQGVVREVYQIDRWQPADTLTYHTRDAADLRRTGRWEFEGSPAETAVREKYIDQLVSQYFTGSAQNPITYVNC
jgi:hypothetical protein